MTAKYQGEIRGVPVSSNYRYVVFSKSQGIVSRHRLECWARYVCQMSNRRALRRGEWGDTYAYRWDEERAEFVLCW